MSNSPKWSYLSAESCHIADIDDPTGNELREFLREQAARFLPGDAVVLYGSDEVWLYHAEDRRRCPGFNEVAAAWAAWVDECEEGARFVKVPLSVDLLIALNDGTVGTIRAGVRWEPRLVGVEVGP